MIFCCELLKASRTPARGVLCRSSGSPSQSRWCANARRFLAPRMRARSGYSYDANRSR
jgi:hypothetical protein